MIRNVLTLTSRYRIPKVVAIVLAIGCLVWTIYPLSLVASQGGNKSISEMSRSAGDPVRITAILVERKPAKLNESFVAGTDWIQDMEVVAKNFSDKDIIYVELQMLMPDTTLTGNAMFYRIKLGNKPNLPVVNQPLVLHPNEETTFSLKKEYQSFLKFINSRHNIADIKRLEIRIGFVVYSDLTASDGNLRFKQDPNNLNRWLPQTVNSQ